MPRKELADELRELRKTSNAHKSVSKLKLFEISSEIEKLKNIRATTPAVASYSGSKDTANIGSSVDDVKEAKQNGFPSRPEKKGEKAKVSKGVIQKEKKSDVKPVSEKKKMTTKMTEEKPVKKVARKAKKMVEEQSESNEE